MRLRLSWVKVSAPKRPLHQSEKKKFVLFFIIYIILFANPAYPNLSEIRTEKTLIKFKDINDVYRMNSKLKFEQETSFLKSYLLNSNLSHQPLCTDLCPKVDGLLFKVCRILPKCPNRQPLLSIELMNNVDEVRQNFAIISPFQAGVPDSLEGVFLLKFNVVYISMKEFRAGVLAHEMTHYLLCQFSPIPDMDLQEKWAQYVDTVVESTY